MKICTICKARFRGNPQRCPLDGGMLEELPSPLLGRTFGGRWEVTEDAGANLFVARDPEGGRVHLQTYAGDDSVRADEALRSAQETRRIEHERVRRVLDSGVTDDGIAWVALEHLEGKPLESMLEGGGLPPAVVRRLAHDVASGLAAGHAMGVVHLALRPASVFVTDGPPTRAKLLGFGGAVAPLQVGRNRQHVVRFALSYKAPEQVRGEPTDERTDVFLFGMLVYEMATGRMAFENPAPGVFIDPTIPELGVAADPVVKNVVERAMAAEPAKRFASMQDVASMLDGAS